MFANNRTINTVLFGHIFSKHFCCWNNLRIVLSLHNNPSVKNQRFLPTSLYTREALGAANCLGNRFKVGVAVLAQGADDVVG